MKLLAPLSLTFLTPLAPFSVGVIVTLSPVLRVNSTCPSVPSITSVPYVTVYFFQVCAVASYGHDLLSDETLSSFVLFSITKSPGT